MKKFENAAFRGAVFFLALCAAPVALGAINVGLEVKNGALVVTSNNAQCPDGPIDCIEVKKGTQPHLFFDLKDACSSTANYKLTEFRITEREKQWPNSGDPLSAQIAEDFCADGNTGYVDFTDCNNSLRDNKMKVKDKNHTVTSVYYKITAANCDDPRQVINLDPRIDNGGGN